MMMAATKWHSAANQNENSNLKKYIQQQEHFHYLMSMLRASWSADFLALSRNLGQLCFLHTSLHKYKTSCRWRSTKKYCVATRPQTQRPRPKVSVVTHCLSQNVRVTHLGTLAAVLQAVSWAISLASTITFILSVYHFLYTHAHTHTHIFP